jgi:hypothetical protein
MILEIFLSTPKCEKTKVTETQYVFGNCAHFCFKCHYSTLINSHNRLMCVFKEFFIVFWTHKISRVTRVGSSAPKGETNKFDNLGFFVYPNSIWICDFMCNPFHWKELKFEDNCPFISAGGSASTARWYRYVELVLITGSDVLAKKNCCANPLWVG